MTEYRVVTRKSFYDIRKYIDAYGCLSKKRKVSTVCQNTAANDLLCNLSETRM